MTTTTTTITRATGNTFAAKTWLKAAGFEWMGQHWVFRGEFDVETLWNQRYANPTWNGRRNAAICQGVKFENRTAIL